MSTRAAGTFDVTLTPQPPAAGGVGRMTIGKQFHGALAAASAGEMLSALTDVKGSAGYVALERVTGSLDGKSGSFVLQHSGTMTRGAAQLTITVVPDSGTGELSGITGSMAIEITDGRHYYDFTYSLP